MSSRQDKGAVLEIKRIKKVKKKRIKLQDDQRISEMKIKRYKYL